MEPARVAEAVSRCLDRHPGRTGKEVTPALLACLAEETEGHSLTANLALLESNARLAAEVASTRPDDHPTRPGSSPNRHPTAN